jgi:DNA repair exonuclease SbcCD ATPase subunit
MTGGQRRNVQVDEDFEKILIDGQSIETLSGSAKAVANLAIRLGLGQVLTNRVFSVFMGDEIDASMDQDRAGYTAECLNGLSSVIGQIILISHKELPVQHQIKIG